VIDKATFAKNLQNLLPLLPDGFAVAGSEKVKIENTIADMKNATGLGGTASPAVSPAASPTGYYGKGKSKKGKSKKGKSKKGKKDKGKKSKGKGTGKGGAYVAPKAPIVQPTASPTPAETTAKPTTSLFDVFKPDSRVQGSVGVDPSVRSRISNGVSSPSAAWSPASPAWSPASSPVVPQPRSYSHDIMDTSNQVLSPVYDNLAGVRKSRKPMDEGRAAHKVQKLDKKGKKRERV
jgi:hypothetical protein